MSSDVRIDKMKEFVQGISINMILKGPTLRNPNAKLVDLLAFWLAAIVNVYFLTQFSYVIAQPLRYYAPVFLKETACSLDDQDVSLLPMPKSTFLILCVIEFCYQGLVLVVRRSLTLFRKWGVCVVMFLNRRIWILLLRRLTVTMSPDSEIETSCRYTPSYFSVFSM